MSTYIWFVLAGLSFSVFFNLYQPRSLYLTFVSFIFIVLAGQALPDPTALPEVLQPYWFLILSAIELSFAAFALATKAKQAACVALFSLCNIIGHLFGYITYTHGFDAYNQYALIIRAGESSQIIALTLLSNHFLRFWAWYRATAKDHDGGHRFQSTAG